MIREIIKILHIVDDKESEAIQIAKGKYATPMSFKDAMKVVKRNRK